MILKKHKNFKLVICNPKGEPFHWKPVYSGSLHNYHRLENGKEFMFVNTWSYYIPVVISVYWLWWKLYIKIFPKLLSGKTPIKYVEFNKTHLPLLNLEEGSWRD